MTGGLPLQNRNRPPDFSTVVVRCPAPSAVNGETTANLGPADYSELLSHHRAYVSTLGALGVDVVELDALEDFPDAYFVEDSAIVTPEIAVMMRPGADSRRDEPAHMKETLSRFRAVEEIRQPGTIDGGDVLVAEKHCMIGLSARTNREGAEQLSAILSGFGFRCDLVEVPEALHFKSSVNYLDNRTLLVTPTCDSLDCVTGYRRIVVPEGEEYAANVVWMNGTILLPDGFPGTLELLMQHGYDVQVMQTSEFEKLDGGLTCLSLRLT